MYRLFLDAVSSEGKICLFEGNTMLAKEMITLSGNESSQLPAKVFSFLEHHSIKLEEMEYISVVHGPGSFTGIRSICLFVNTLAYVYPKLRLSAISFFDLFTTYPIVKQSSRRDVFVKKAKESIIEIVAISELSEYLAETKNWQGSLDLSLGDLSDIHLNSHYDEVLILNGEKREYTRFIEPLYIKKPNIT